MATVILNEDESKSQEQPASVGEQQTQMAVAFGEMSARYQAAQVELVELKGKIADMERNGEGTRSEISAMRGEMGRLIAALEAEEAEEKAEAASGEAQPITPPAPAPPATGEEKPTKKKHWMFR